MRSLPHSSYAAARSAYASRLTPLMRWLGVAVVLALAACGAAPTPVAAPKPRTVTAASGEDSGAISSAVKPDAVVKAEALNGNDWPPLKLVDGEATLRCDGDALPESALAADAGEHAPSGVERMREAVQRSREALSRRHDAADAEAERANIAAGNVGQAGDAASADRAPADARDAVATAATEADAGETEGHALTDLGFFSVVDAVTPCRDVGALRLQYSGKIGADFTALMQRVSAIAERMDIPVRVLDIDSSGGRVEDAMRAGDVIAESRWTIDVAPDAICHSACSLVLAAGDDREIAGQVGIHRMIRIGSQATSRAEVSQELRSVYGQMKDYLERNGASVAVADLMMTVPNRRLRLLTADELQAYGLSGANAVQDDLDRIRLTRECGDAFVKRKDAYARAFETQCATRKDDREATRSCGLALREKLEFPDDRCRVDRPLAKTG